MNTAAASTADAAREALFGESLACDEIRPAAFRPEPIDEAIAHSHGQRAEGLLRALSVVEDGRGDEPEEHTPSDLALFRVEAKLDLLTVLVARLAKSDRDDPLQPLRWSARGACLPAAEPLPVGTTGSFRVQPVDWLPEPLQLPATVLACIPGQDGAPAQLWLRFGPLSPQLDLALERHLFRVHRREIAERRRPR